MNNLPNLSKHATVLNLVLTVFLLGSLLITAFTINSVRSLQSEARNIKIGTITLTNGPIHYHQVAQFSYTLPMKPQGGNFIVSCYQNNKWVFAAENLSWQVPKSLQGSLSLLMANESQTLFSGLDYTIPAACYGYIADEGTPNGKPTVIVTNAAGFTVSP